MTLGDANEYIPAGFLGICWGKLVLALAQSKNLQIVISARSSTRRNLASARMIALFRSDISLIRHGLSICSNDFRGLLH
jgi:hypothetical protein